MVFALFICLTLLVGAVALAYRHNKENSQRIDEVETGSAFQTHAQESAAKSEMCLQPCISLGEYVILDVETTGLNAYRDKIIQISAIKYDAHGKVLDRYNTYVNPGISIPASASAVNHITDDLVSGAPYAEEIADEFLAFVGNNVVVGYNVTFDLKFLNSTFGGAFLGRQYIDALSIARQCFALSNYRLETVAASAGFRSSSFHNSLVDCEAVAAVLRCANVDLGEWVKEFGERRSSAPAYNPAQSVYRPSSYVENSRRGYEYWKRGEEARAEGDFTTALQLYDRARKEGFRSSALYSSYAKIYRKRKEYDLEIAILEEAVNFCDGPAGEEFFARRERAKELRGKAEKNAADEALRIQKREERAARKMQEEEAKAQRTSQRNSRRIRQLSDEGEILGEFMTLAEAARAIGVNSKSIREAATGKQKRAGGFLWEYEVEEQAVSESDTEKAAPNGAADVQYT